MGSHRQLPLELVDEILDNVQDDKLTLASFSTVCKQWSPSARRRLFRVLKLCAGAVPDMPHAKYPTLDVPDWKRWAREFAATPTLPSYVHELHVFGDNPVCEPEFLMEVCTYQDEDGKSIAEGTNFEVVGTDALFAMAQVLPNLKRVILHSIMVKCAALPSHDPIPLEYLRLDMVYSLDGENILELFEVFAPNEVHADVYARSGEDVTEPLKPLSEPPPRGLIGTKWYIRSDEDSTALFRDLLRTSFVRHIQSLDVALTGDDDELIAFISLFQVIAPRLKQLVLDLFEALIWAIDFTTFIRPFRQLWGSDFTLAPCSNLQRLGLSIRIYRDQIPFDRLEMLLDTVPSHVTEMALAISSAPDILEIAPWERVDRPLSRLQGLQSIKLDICNEYRKPLPEDVQPRIFNFLQGELPGIRRILTIGFRTCDEDGAS